MPGNFALPISNQESESQWQLDWMRIRHRLWWFHRFLRIYWSRMRQRFSQVSRSLELDIHPHYCFSLMALTENYLREIIRERLSQLRIKGVVELKIFLSYSFFLTMLVWQSFICWLVIKFCYFFFIIKSLQLSKERIVQEQCLLVSGKTRKYIGLANKILIDSPSFLKVKLSLELMRRNRQLVD